MSIDLEKIKKQTGFQYIVNSEGVVCRLVPIDKARKQDEFLRIIKEKKVDVAILLECESLHDYNDYMNGSEMYREYSNSRKLTKEEFDLLQEVLL